MAEAAEDEEKDEKEGEKEEERDAEKVVEEAERAWLISMSLFQVGMKETSFKVDTRSVSSLCVQWVD